VKALKALNALLAKTGPAMATLTIRNLPDDVRDRLRQRAAKAGRSMEAEVRALLTEASLSEQRATSAEALQEWVDRLYGDQKPSQVVEDLIAERRKEARKE
jgi:plasmid stability protein